MRAAKGDISGATASGLDAMQMGNEIPRQGVILPKLVGIACESIGREQMWKLSHQMNATTARTAIQRLEKMQTVRVSCEETFQEEAWAAQASWGARLQEPEMQPVYILQHLPQSQPKSVDDWKGVFRLLFDRRGIVRDNVETIERAAKFIHDNPYSTSKPFPKEKAGTLIVINPVLKPMWFKETQAQMANALLLTTLALQAYRMEHGTYPKTLPELVQGGYLSRIPTDPFAPNGALRYRLKTPTHFLLYSVGPDAKDDGGKPIFHSNNTPNRSTAVAAEDTGDFVVRVNTP